MVQWAYCAKMSYREISHSSTVDYVVLHYNLSYIQGGYQWNNEHYLNYIVLCQKMFFC